MAEEIVYEEFKQHIVPKSWKSREWKIEDFKEFYEDTIKDKKAMEKWWGDWASKMFWFKKWDTVLDDSKAPFYRWFVGGQTNLAYLCLDWQLDQGRKNKIALIWEGEPYENGPKDVKKYTYEQLTDEANRITYALKTKLKVKKGETLTYYLPMIPELPLYMLAVQRMGASHSIVYSGFSALALAERVIAANSRIIVTSDGLFRRGKVTVLKTIVDDAVKICEERGHKVEKVIVVKRTRTDIPWSPKTDIWHEDFLKDVPAKPKVDTEKLGSEDISYILYTSGTTGAPKGAQHSIGGYAVGLYNTMHLIFDIKDSDVYWCTADIGWVTGHSYIVYGPLMTGATTLIYEGSPDFPAPDRWWGVIERYKVSIFYTAPTAIRMLMKFPVELVKKHDMSSLRIVHSVGEPINPEAYRWYYKNLCREDCVASSTWWMTETGQMLTGHFPGLGKIFPMKPGTNGYPLPGVSMDVFDEDGKLCKPGERGYFCMTSPWPGMFMTLYKDPERFKEVYFSKYKGKNYFYTGDFAVKDADGYVWVIGRADDVLKIAGHRIGTAEIESAMLTHPSVAESACIGKPDPIKGETAYIFTVLKQGYAQTPELEAELKQHLRKTLGPLVSSDATILVVDMVPKTRSGKIMRRLLKSVVSEARLGDMTTIEDQKAVEEAMKAFEYLRKVIEKKETAKAK